MWVWTKAWGSTDDGSTFYGNDVQNLQTDIVNNAVDLSSTQTISGAKTFTGTIVMSGNVTNIPKVSEYVFYDNDLISYDDEAVDYQ